MATRHQLILGLGLTIVGASGCGSVCEDDGPAWIQNFEECNFAEAETDATETNTTEGPTTDPTTDTTTDSDTTPTTAGSESESDPTDDTDTDDTSDPPTKYCKDDDMDGQGNPDECIDAVGDPPPGYVPNDLDCDDTDAQTFTGAAELDDPLKCMTDADDDGYGDNDPKPGVDAGTDCADDNPNAFPGSAELDSESACMEDEDGDGYGDADPPPGVDAGTDCNDEDENTYPGAGENEEDPTACVTDADGDGFGDQNPAPGGVPGTDCDDNSEFTFPGSSPNDDPVACMKDEDDDDYGDDFGGGDPPDGVIPGTDCNDLQADTYPGAAENEVPPGLCQQDIDDDGWGSNSPPDGVEPGLDCDDADETIFQLCADCTPNEYFCKEDESHLCNELGNGSSLEEECEIGCNEADGLCFQELAVDAGSSVCINAGESVQLQAITTGGDGNYMWDWMPGASLDNIAIENPIATPMEATTYTVNVVDGLNQMASDNVSVFIKDAPLVLDDVSCKITNFAYGGNPNVNWNWNPNLSELCQLSNSSPTARFCGWSLDNANLKGRFQVKTGSDDDYVGFLFGIQPFNQMIEEPTQFYYFGWKQGNQLGWCGGGFPQSGGAGMLVKRIDVDDPDNTPLSCADFHDRNDSANAVVLSTEAEFTTQGWLDNVAYIFDLTHTPTGFTIRIIREDNNSVVAEKSFVDDTYPNGQVGFYTFSQQNACFSNYQTSCL
ncbi:MAG: hypothetical protein ACPG77_00165 [Nannocystaceae bacterium]